MEETQQEIVVKEEIVELFTIKDEEENDEEFTRKQEELIMEDENLSEVNSKAQCHTKTCNCKKILRCSQCRYKTDCSDHFKSHFASHSDEKSFVCYHCSHRTKFKGSLKSHMKIHTGERELFKCTICEMSFRYKGLFNYHMLQHTSEILQCTQCPYQSSCIRTFNNHVATHSDERPFVCTRCSFRSKTKKSLCRHMKRHTVQKDNNLQNATKSSNQVSLGSIRTCSSKELFSCELCPYRSNLKWILNEHRKARHSAQSQIVPIQSVELNSFDSLIIIEELSDCSSTNVNSVKDAKC